MMMMPSCLSPLCAVNLFSPLVYWHLKRAWKMASFVDHHQSMLVDMVQACINIGLPFLLVFQSLNGTQITKSHCDSTCSLSLSLTLFLKLLPSFGWTTWPDHFRFKFNASFEETATSCFAFHSIAKLAKWTTFQPWLFMLVPCHWSFKSNSIKIFLHSNR